MIPITRVALPAEVEGLVLEVLRSGHLAQGERVQEFESRFAELHGVAQAVAVNNGTTALIAALQMLDLRPGDEVITSAFTFAATLNAILQTGATARFADIGPDFNIEPEAIETLVNDRSRAVVPVHLFGYPADMARIASIAEGLGLAIVEDAAQAVGASCGETKVGSFGTGCFSLYATKNLSTGEGGMITTNDDGTADRLRLLRNQGMRTRYQYEMVGNNYRMTDLAAAIGLPQLEQLSASNERRQRNAAALSVGLSGIPGLVPPSPPAAGREHVYHQYTVRITEDATVTRDQLVDRLAAEGVGSGVYYPRVVFDYDCYRDDARVHVDEVPGARAAARQVLSLPVHPSLARQDIDQIVAAVRTAMSS